MEECKNRHYFHEAAFGGGTYQQNLIGLVIKIAKCLQQRDQGTDDDWIFIGTRIMIYKSMKYKGQYSKVENE